MSCETFKTRGWNFRLNFKHFSHISRVKLLLNWFAKLKASHCSVSAQKENMKNSLLVDYSIIWLIALIMSTKSESKSTNLNDLKQWIIYLFHTQNFTRRRWHHFGLFVRWWLQSRIRITQTDGKIHSFRFIKCCNWRNQELLQRCSFGKTKKFHSNYSNFTLQLSFFWQNYF